VYWPPGCSSSFSAGATISAAAGEIVTGSLKALCTTGNAVTLNTTAWPNTLTVQSYSRLKGDTTLATVTAGVTTSIL
jgi:hypothetical protein